MIINDNNVSDTKQKKTSKWQHILDILKFIHLPFQPDDKKLKPQVTKILINNDKGLLFLT